MGETYGEMERAVEEAGRRLLAAHWSLRWAWRAARALDRLGGRVRDAVVGDRVSGDA